jgi:hypothetical protein
MAGRFRIRHVLRTRLGCGGGLSRDCPPPDGPRVEGYLFISDNLAAHWQMLDEFEDGYDRVEVTVTTLKASRFKPGFISYSRVLSHKKGSLSPESLFHDSLRLLAFCFAVFDFAHHFQLFRDVATLFGQLSIFDDVVINAVFIVALHAGDDALNSFNAHAWLDVVAQVVEQQNTFLVVTDLLLNVLDFTLQFVFAAEQADEFQNILERRLGSFHFYTPDNVRFGFVKATVVTITLLTAAANDNEYIV